VAAASYGANRLDVFVMDVNGNLYHHVQDGPEVARWSHWNVLEAGFWEGSKRPFAAAYSGHLARLIVGSMQGGAAHMQRYSEW
jgi:hypothetical protein